LAIYNLATVLFYFRVTSFLGITGSFTGTIIIIIINGGTWKQNSEEDYNLRLLKAQKADRIES